MCEAKPMSYKDIGKWVKSLGIKTEKRSIIKHKIESNHMSICDLSARPRMLNRVSQFDSL